VAAEVTQLTTDSGQLLPMLAQIEKNLEQKPEKATYLRIELSSAC
jgi:hypothetical protein